MVGALVGLARAAEGVECPGDGMYRTVIEGLFTTLTNVSFDDDAIRAQIEKTHREKEKLLTAPVRRKAEEKTPAAGTDPAAGNESGEQAADDYNLGLLWDMDPDIRSLKSLILFGLKGMAAYAYHALMLGASDETVNQFFLTGLREIAKDGTIESLLPTVMKVGGGQSHLYGHARCGKYGNLRDTGAGPCASQGGKRSVYRCDRA